MSKRLNPKYLTWALAVFSVFSLVACVCIGPVAFSPSTVFKMIGSVLPGIGESIRSEWTTVQGAVIIQARLPRVLLGFLIGCALAGGGAAMQGLVHNKLADPYILGASYGAAAFAVVGLSMGLFTSFGIYQNAINGCIGALLSLLLIFIFSLNRGHINIDHMLLGGVAVSLFAKALVQVVVMFDHEAFRDNKSDFWTQGGLAGARWGYLEWPSVVIVLCFVAVFVNYRSLNAIMCGEVTAQTLGVSVKSMRKLLVLATSVMVGVSVAVSGGVGFIGLAAPNFVRALVGGNHKYVLPISALLGGVLVLWCDVLARMLLSPEEIPVGIITAILGGPLFLWLLKKRT